MIDINGELLNITIDLHWKEIEIEDLKDDIIENFKDHLYEFINGDPEKAFYTGFLLAKMLYDEKELEIEQYLLYSREFRHKMDNLDKYGEQISYWQNKYKESNNTMIKLDVLEYILNNIFYDSYSDLLDMCLRFGEMCNEKDDV